MIQQLPILRTLIIEDSADDVALLTRVFRKLPFDVRYHCVDTAEALDKALDEAEWDLALSDFAMPRFDGLSALRAIRGRGLDIPFILVTGTIGEDRAVELMKSGANDYVMKGNLTRLGPAIERELKEAESRREQCRAQEALREIDERNRAIITTAADGIITFDSLGA